MKEDITANQENIFKVLVFSLYISEKIKYLRFLLPNYISEEI